MQAILPMHVGYVGSHVSPPRSGLPNGFWSPMNSRTYARYGLGAFRTAALPFVDSGLPNEVVVDRIQHPVSRTPQEWGFFHAACSLRRGKRVETTSHGPFRCPKYTGVIKAESNGRLRREPAGH